MIFIREEHANDMEAIHQVNQLAFKGDGEANLVAALRKTGFFIPSLSLVAVEDGIVIGHILFTRIVIKDGKRTYPAIALAPLGVVPEHQNKGVGTMLVKAGLEKCKYMGYKSIIVLGDPNYYKRFGFKLASEYEITPPVGFPEEAFMVCEIMHSDNPVKGIVHYPREFLAL